MAAPGAGPGAMEAQANASRYKGITYRAHNGKWKSNIMLKDNDREDLPPHLAKLTTLTGGHYASAYDAAKASDKILYKLGRATNLLLSQRELIEVEATTWDDLLASFRATGNDNGDHGGGGGGGGGGTLFSKGSSVYRGVSWHKSSRKWKASIGAGKKVSKAELGLFDSEKAAARAYDSAASFLYGSSAKLNFKDKMPAPPDARVLPKLLAQQAVQQQLMQLADNVQQRQAQRPPRPHQQHSGCDGERSDRCQGVRKRRARRQAEAASAEEEDEWVPEEEEEAVGQGMPQGDLWWEAAPLGPGGGPWAPSLQPNELWAPGLLDSSVLDELCRVASDELQQQAEQQEGAMAVDVGGDGEWGPGCGQQQPMPVDGMGAEGSHLLEEQRQGAACPPHQGGKQADGRQWRQQREGSVRRPPDCDAVEGDVGYQAAQQLVQMQQDVAGLMQEAPEDQVMDDCDGVTALIRLKGSNDKLTGATNSKIKAGSFASKFLAARDGQAQVAASRPKAQGGGGPGFWPRQAQQGLGPAVRPQAATVEAQEAGAGAVGGAQTAQQQGGAGAGQQLVIMAGVGIGRLQQVQVHAGPTVAGAEEKGAAAGQVQEAANPRPKIGVLLPRRGSQARTCGGSNAAAMGQPDMPAPVGSGALLPGAAGAPLPLLPGGAKAPAPTAAMLAMMQSMLQRMQQQHQQQKKGGAASGGLPAAADLDSGGGAGPSPPAASCSPEAQSGGIGTESGGESSAGGRKRRQEEEQGVSCGGCGQGASEEEAEAAATLAALCGATADSGSGAQQQEDGKCMGRQVKERRKEEEHRSKRGRAEACKHASRPGPSAQQDQQGTAAEARSAAAEQHPMAEGSSINGRSAPVPMAATVAVPVAPVRPPVTGLAAGLGASALQAQQQVSAHAAGVPAVAGSSGAVGVQRAAGSGGHPVLMGAGRSSVGVLMPNQAPGLAAGQRQQQLQPGPMAGRQQQQPQPAPQPLQPGQTAGQPVPPGLTARQQQMQPGLAAGQPMQPGLSAMQQQLLTHAARSLAGTLPPQAWQGAAGLAAAQQLGGMLGSMLGQAMGGTLPNQGAPLGCAVEQTLGAGVGAALPPQSGLQGKGGVMGGGVMPVPGGGAAQGPRAPAQPPHSAMQGQGGVMPAPGGGATQGPRAPALPLQNAVQGQGGVMGGGVMPVPGGGAAHGPRAPGVMPHPTGPVQGLPVGGVGAAPPHPGMGTALGVPLTGVLPSSQGASAQAMGGQSQLLLHRQGVVAPGARQQQPQVPQQLPQEQQQMLQQQQQRQQQMLQEQQRRKQWQQQLALQQKRLALQQRQQLLAGMGTAAQQLEQQRLLQQEQQLVEQQQRFAQQQKMAQQTPGVGAASGGSGMAGAPQQQQSQKQQQVQQPRPQQQVPQQRPQQQAQKQQQPTQQAAGASKDVRAALQQQQQQQQRPQPAGVGAAPIGAGVEGAAQQQQRSQQQQQQQQHSRAPVAASTSAAAARHASTAPSRVPGVPAEALAAARRAAAAMAAAAALQPTTLV